MNECVTKSVDLNSIGEAIRISLQTLTATLRDATGKMHILEHHMLEWISQHHVGCGLMGEQGAKSIHSQFNSLTSTYKTIADPVERLRCVMKEHYLFFSKNSNCNPS